MEHCRQEHHPHPDIQVAHHFIYIQGQERIRLKVGEVTLQDTGEKESINTSSTVMVAA